MSLLISVNNGILGGAPVIRGTRIPVERLVALANQGRLTTTHLEEEYPQISPEKIYSIIAYLMERGLHAFEEDQA